MNLGQPNVLRESSWVKVRFVKQITHRVMAAHAQVAFVTRNMVRSRHSVPNLANRNAINREDTTRDFVAQHNGGSRSSVPLHHIASANAAELHTHECLAAAGLRYCPVLDPALGPAVITCNAHSGWPLTGQLR